MELFYVNTRLLECNSWVQKGEGCDALMRAQFFAGLSRGETGCFTCVPAMAKLVSWLSQTQTFALSQDLAPLVECVENTAVLLSGIGQESDDMGTIWCAGGQEAREIHYILCLPISGKTRLEL